MNLMPISRVLGRTLLVLACASGAAPASAAPFTWIVTGQITNNSDPYDEFEDILAVGQTYTWTLNMESTAPDHYPLNPGCGGYQPHQSATFTSGGLSSTTGPASVVLGDFTVATYASNLCDIPQGLIRIGMVFHDDLGRPLFTFLYLFLPRTAMDDALPIHPPVQSGFLEITSHFAERGTGIRQGSITSITAVPEPATLGLLAVGLLGLWRRRVWAGGKGTPRG
jgi:hypothetical protein